jgi:hypothetical protein
MARSYLMSGTRQVGINPNASQNTDFDRHSRTHLLCLLFSESKSSDSNNTT